MGVFAEGPGIAIKVIGGGGTSFADSGAGDAKNFGNLILNPPSSSFSLALDVKVALPACSNEYMDDDVGCEDEPLQWIAGLHLIGGSSSWSIPESEQKRAAWSLALDLLGGLRLNIEAKSQIYVELSGGISLRGLLGEATDDEDFLRSALGSDGTFWGGFNVNLMLNAGDIYVGLQILAVFGDSVSGLTGGQVVPIIGFRGGLDVGERKPKFK